MHAARLAGIVALLAVSACANAVNPARVAVDRAQATKRANQNATAGWTCAMHPEVQAANAGKCPICGMDLVPVAVK